MLSQNLMKIDQELLAKCYEWEITEVDRIAFMAFDIVHITKKISEQDDLLTAEGKSLLEKLISKNNYYKVVPYEIINSTNE